MPDRRATYAHDAECNTIHEAGPQPCPPPRDDVSEPPPELLTADERQAVYDAALPPPDHTKIDEMRLLGWPVRIADVDEITLEPIRERHPCDESDWDET